MKKFLIVIVTSSILVAAGYLGYNYAISYLSDQMVDSMMENMLNDEEVEKFLEDPGIREFIDTMDIDQSVGGSVGPVDQELLPFTTKEDALKTVLREFSLGEVSNLSDQAMAGNMTMEEAEAYLGERLTEEEIQALKIVLIKEFQNR